jgi:predicted DNA-binding transcriptional regulator AlpA
VHVVPKPDVMGLTEIAQRLGLSKRYAREITGRKGFPEPTHLAMGYVWSSKDIEAWIAKNRPEPAGDKPDAG